MVSDPYPVFIGIAARSLPQNLPHMSRAAQHASRPTAAWRLRFIVPPAPGVILAGFIFSGLVS
jgi:hypothetical protein